ncbi:stage II sporulation protein R [Ornithinibacillus sp. L9]|uniref:Stage II sporulation protein R n=1 Tax=Ornithinibacillus caprae TaxID=2678566 RepID=A0A6N8FQ34_9BACI|nr:stage II sporulation protein R [Ornithinibacillus caprae]MUK89638.1 stage II sporulation protein R [Ornithinibacillus caprae]
MKKLVFFVFIFFIIFLSMPAKGQGNGSEMDYQVIPDDAIRLRILANSDQDEDQKLKHQVRDNVNAEITKWVEHMTDINEARELIASKVPEIEEIVDQTLEDAGEKRDFDVEYGKNVSFPTKLYGNYLYPAGEYEAVLITLGEGQGANWWCVLFPPLCFLDFGDGISVAEASAEELDEPEEEEEEEPVKVKFFLFEWLGWS